MSSGVGNKYSKPGAAHTRRVVHGARQTSTMTLLPPTSSSLHNSGKSAALWSAVALQQHMLRSMHGVLPTSGAPILPPRPGKLTLAEKMGLVEAPPPPPTDAQWETAVAKSLTRSDCSRECSICQVAFVASAESPQAILSCSHLFHEQCIRQFEKFVRRSGATPSCPVCRAPRYHRRAHFEGKAQVQHHAATKIQAWFRGLLQRKRYFLLKLRSNQKFRVDYAVTQLRAISDSHLARAAAREKEVDRMLEELDLTRQKALADMLTPKEWESIRNTVLTRHDGLECPICMGTIDANDAAVGSGSGASQSVRPHAYMLSCAHCFHGPCLESFESFAAASAVQSSDSRTIPISRCPVCRAGYAKRSLVDE